MRLMRSVAKRVTLSLCESKRFTVLNESFTPGYTGNRQYYFGLRNLFAVIPTGAPQSYARIGSEIVHPWVKIKFTFRTNWQSMFSSGNYGAVYFYAYIVSTIDEDVFPGSTVSSYPFASQGTTGDPGWFLQPDPARTTLNGNNIKILKAWRRRIYPDQVMYASGQAGVTPVVYGVQDVVGIMKYKWPRKLTYMDLAVGAPTPGNPNTSAILRDTNYYFMAGWGVTGSAIATANQPQCAVDSYMYFKDP